MSGGPRNVKECKEVSVHTITSRLVSAALTNSDPDPKLKSPAVPLSVISQSRFVSKLDHLINNGS